MSARRPEIDSVAGFARSTLQALTATIAVGVILATLGIGIGLANGYRPVIITTGSMSPTAPAGSLLVAAPADRLAPGDILVMRRDGRATVTHRIVEIEYNASGDPYAVTRGDANAEIDAAPYALTTQELTGRWVVPGFGRLLLAMGSPFAAIAVVLLAVTAITLSLLRRIWRDPEPAPAPISARPVGRSKRMRIAGASVFLGVTMAGSGVAWSLYFGVASVGSNVFATAECFDARLSGIQKGQTTSSADGLQIATIAAVDPTRSFLQFTVRSNSNEPADSQVLGRLVDATTVEFQRQTDAGSPPAIVVEWSVVSYACGVSVQRGVVDADGSSQIDTTISAIDPSSSFVLSSSVPDSAASDFDSDDLSITELIGADTVRIRTAGAALNVGRRIAWQVVTFDDPGDATTQVAFTSLGPGAGTATVTLAQPVDLRTTFLIAHSTSSSTGSEVGERSVRVRLLDSTTIEVSRLVTTEWVDVQIQTVQLSDGTTVRHGIVDLGPGELSASVAIPPVDTSRSTIGSTVAVPGSLSGGATDFVADDVIGEASVSAVLADAATITLERGTASSTASFAWQVITWGGPSWADPLTPFRQRIDITAGGVDAPNGYTTPLTFDHGALVDAGLALPGGQDARIWRYDGATWTELDRVLDESSAWNNPATTLWFRTQESIASGERVSYWLYFGNETPPPVLDNPDNVWLLREGFESGTLGSFADRTDGTGWYRAQPWTRRKILTIDSSNVSAPLTDQVVLVRVSDPDLTTHAQADGSDIRFTSADGVTSLPHEVEEWDRSTDTLTAWVRVPFLSSSVDTVIHLYYGAFDAPSQANPRLTWGAETAAWNLSRDPAGPAPTLDDSGPANHDGLAFADTAAATSPSGPAVLLDGTTDRLEAAPFDLSGESFTVAAWFRPDGLGTDPVVVAQGDPNGSGVFELGVDTQSVPGSPTARFVLRVDGAAVEVSGGPIVIGSWHHVAATWDGSTITLHVNGAVVDTVAASGLTPNGSTMPVVLGGNPDGSRTLDGLLGQVRLSESAWNSARVGFAAANLASPSASVVSASAQGATWFDQGDWTLRRPIIVDADQVDATLSDFPLLVQLVDPDLGANAQSDGDDLVFVAADGVTRLDHELESWNSTTGAITAWVRLPVLDDLTDTKLFLYLGNPIAVGQTDPRGVFGPDADLVLNGPTG